MPCKIPVAIVGVLCLVYCTSNVYAALGAACNGTAGTVGDCDGNNEVCNADPICECDDTTGYEVSSDDNTVCALKDCSANTPTPTGYTITSPTLVGDTSTVACDTGYTGPPTATTLNCQTNGNYDAAFAGCSLVGGGGIDLGNACTNNAECTSGNGGSGSKCDTNCVCDTTNSYVENSSTCKLAIDLGNACSANEECTLGNGGAGATCSTNCVCDEASGYTESGSTCTKNAGTNLLSMFNVVSMLAIILMMKLM